VTSVDSIEMSDSNNVIATFNVTVNDQIEFAETISKIALFQASISDQANFSATAMEVSQLPEGRVSVSFTLKSPGVGIEGKTAKIIFNIK
jgi:hypothetical protein